MSHVPRPPDRERTFTSLYDAVYPDVMRFVQRRAHPDHAEDVISEALLVVWRRLDEVPCTHDDARAWIFGITRNMLLNNPRSEQRRRALGVRLADAKTLPSTDADTLPSVAGGDQAFATWTAAPDRMSAQQQAQAVADCRENHEDGPGALAEYADDIGGADPVIAERRGVWTTVVLAGSDGFSAECITDDSALLFAKGMIGSVGRPTRSSRSGSPAKNSSAPTPRVSRLR